MAMDRKDVTSTLNDLIQIDRDGEEGFRTSAENVKDAELRALFQQYATQRAGFATELQSEVERLGEEATDRSDVRGALHRGWMNLRTAIQGDDDHAILAEAERGEDAAKEAYEDALNKPLPTDIKTLVERQYREVRQAHDHVRDLRDRYRSRREAS